jgi:hypothetical protein
MKIRLWLTSALLLAVPTLGAAQAVPKKFQVSVDAAWQNYAESAALKDAPMAGLRGLYFINSHIGVGASVMAGRPWTKGEYFPLVRHSYLSGDQTNDTTLLYQANMRTTHLQFGVDATYRHALGNLVPFVTAGIGRYRFNLDPEQMDGLKEMSGMAYAIGGGAEWSVTPSSAIRFSIQDNVLNDFDRDNFCINCTGRWNLVREDRFPNPFPVPPAKESTIHNLRFIGSFSFVPGEDK